MSLIEAVFDHDYYSGLAHLSELKWNETLEHYISNGVKKCILPNGLDPLYNAFYVKQPGEDFCIGNEDWFGKISNTKSAIVLNNYFLSNEGVDSEGVKIIFKKYNLYTYNLHEISKYSFKSLEELGDGLASKFSPDLINYYQGKVINQLAKIDNYLASKTLINDFIIKELDSKYKLKSYLKQGFCQSASKLLTNYILKQNTDTVELIFFEEFLKKTDLDTNIKKDIFLKIGNTISSIYWDYKPASLTKYIALIKYSNDSQEYKISVLKAIENNNFVTDDAKVILEFSRFLDEATLRDGAADFITRSLVNILHKSNHDLAFVEKQAEEVFTRTSTLGKELTREVFTSFGKQQKYFGNLVVNIIAEDKNLPKDILHNLAQSIKFDENLLNSLFVALRLSQHNINFAEPIIENLLEFIATNNIPERVLAINVLLNQSLPTKAIDSIFNNIEKFSLYEINLIKEKLKNYKLTSEQQNKLNVCATIQLENEFIKQNLHIKFQKESQLLDAINNLNQNLGWPIEVIAQHIAKFENLHFIKELYIKLSDYSICPEMVDRHGNTVLKLLENGFEVLSKINLLIRDNHFYVPKTIEDFLTKFRELNLDKPYVIDLIDSGYFVKQIEAMDQARAKLDMHKWTKEDFILWKNNYFSTIDYNDLGEVLAVITTAIYKTYSKEEWYPRFTQIISLLTLLKYPTGGLAEIATGEGKSIIIAMLAMVKILDSHKVDVITSSKVLARRDAEDFKDFYSMLGFTSGHNQDNDSDGTKDCYNYDIVYGDTLTFIGDELRDASKNIKRGRAHDILVIDEVDNGLIDHSRMKVQISNKISGAEYLSPLLTYIWGTGAVAGSNLKLTDKGCYSIYDKNNITYTGSNSCDELVLNIISNFTDQYIYELKTPKENRALQVPNHLSNFALSQKDNWIQSFVSSFELQNDINYIVYNDTKSLNVAPIDIDTGEIQKGTHWSNGLHPMLQVKNKVPVSSENVINTFMSFVAYFHKYKGNIFGLTGTLGEESHHDFLKQQYGVELSTIPTYIAKDLVIFPEIVTSSYKEWENAILETLALKILNKRAALIIFSTVAEVEYFHKVLLDECFTPSKLFTYGKATIEESDLIKREFGTGDIIIATNLAGRGTDIKISPAVKKNGGLHVIQTFLAPSIRIEDQASGRSARNGDPGSTQVILIAQSEIEDIDLLRSIRDKQENKTLELGKLCDFPSISLRDKLYENFEELSKDISSPTDFRIRIGIPESSQISYPTIFISKDANNRIITTISGTEQIKLDITDHLKIVDMKSYEHLLIALSKEKASALDINKQDYELLHFIFSISNYTKHPVFLNRVNEKFNNIVGNHHSSWFGNAETSYLMYLLNTDHNYSDLKAKDDVVNDEVLKNVKLRKQFELWLVDRGLYNQEWEISQIAENFGYWLKQQEKELSSLGNCSLDNQEYFRQTFRIIEQNISKNFEEFKSETYKIAKDDLLQNPAFSVLKAWRYLQIYAYSSDSSKSFVSSENSYFSTIFNSIKNIVKNSFDAVFPTNNFYVYNPLVDAATILQRALILEDKFSWTANNALAYVALTKDGANIVSKKDANQAMVVKNNVALQLSIASNKIENVVIPSIKSHFSYLVNSGIANFSDPIVSDLIGKESYYNAVAKNLKNSALYIGSLPSSSMIKVSRGLEFEEVSNNVNVTQDFLNYINQTKPIESIGNYELHKILKNVEFAGKEDVRRELVNSGGFLFEISSYELQKEKKNWFGTALGVVLGIVSIAAGVGVIAYGIGGAMFSSSLGVSLISMGVGDLINSAASIIQGQPIEMNSYLKSKGMALGIAIVTAGTLSFLEHIAQAANIQSMLNMADQAKTFAASAASNPTAFIAKALLTQSLATGISAVMLNVGKKVIDKDDIYQSAENLINDIIANFHEYLARIYITDELRHNNELFEALKIAINKAIVEHQQMFHDDATQYTTGVGGNLVGHAFGGYTAFGMAGLAGVINSGVKMAMGSYKNSEALGEIGKDTKNAIAVIGSNFAFSKDALFKLKLQSNYADQGEYLFNTMAGSYSNCAQVESIAAVNDFKGYDVKSVCDEVAKILSRKDFDSLKSYFKESVGQLIISIQKNEILKPATDQVGTESASRIAKFIEDKFKEYQKENSKAEATGEKRQRQGIDLKKVRESMKNQVSEFDLDDDHLEDAVLKDILKENKASQPSKSLQQLKEDIACVDVHRVLSGNPEMQEVSVKLYQHLVKNGLSENEALAILGNSLIKINENPFATAQNAAFPLALGAVEACATNPACVNLVALTLTGAVAAGKILVEGFDVAEEIDSIMWTPEQNYKSQDEEFLADTKVNNIPGFDWEEYFNTDEGFTTPEGIDMSVLAKVEIKDGKIITEGFNLGDSEGGAHGGHSEERHVGKSGGYLDRRIVNEGKKAATTFPDYKTATEAVKEVLKHNNDDIVKWAESAPDGRTKAFSKDFDKEIGYGITKEGIKFNSNKAKVVLIKVGKEIEVLTSYPVK